MKIAHGNEAHQVPPIALGMNSCVVVLSNSRRVISGFKNDSNEELALIVKATDRVIADLI